MRVAQRMISRNYKRQINSSMKKQSDALERSESGLAFKYLSENVASGSRAMYLQEQRYAAQQQLDNVKNLMAEQKSIDSNLSSIHSILQSIQERVLTGMSQDWGETAREVIAQEIEKKMEQLLQFGNAQFGGHTLFGGTNNSVPPFTVDEKTGKLQFNGINVEDIFKSAVDGKYYYYPTIPDPDHPESGDIQYNFSVNGATGSFYGDGETFHVHPADTDRQYTVIDGTKYYLGDDGITYLSENGDSFQTNGTGYDRVVIDGITYVKGTTPNGEDYYFEEGVDPNNPATIVGKVFSSNDGLNFVEMDTVLVDNDDHIPTVEIKGPKSGGASASFTYPPEMTADPLGFKVRDGGGYSQVDINGKNYVLSGTDEDGNLLYKSADPFDKTVYSSIDGLTFTQIRDEKGDEVQNGQSYTFTNPEKVLGDKKEVPNSRDTFVDIGLGLKIKSSDMMADPRTAYQMSFSGLTIFGCAGVSADGETFPDAIVGANGTVVAGNLYDLLGQIRDALRSPMDKNGLDDMFTQLVNLTDEVGMVRTDLGNRMQYLELTETRLDDDIENMTNLESDLISSDPAMEAIKMKECEYVWLALMQLGSKVLPASLLDFMS